VNRAAMVSRLISKPKRSSYSFDAYNPSPPKGGVSAWLH